MNEKPKQKRVRHRYPKHLPIATMVDGLSRRRGRVKRSTLRAILDDFSVHGAAAVAEARLRYPATYLKLAAAFLPVDPGELEGGAERCPLCGAAR